MGMTTAHKEMVSHIRKRLRANSINARVRGMVICGNKVIQVIAPKHGYEWSTEELRKLRLVATVNKLTFSHNMPIHAEETFVQLTGKNQWEFYFHG